ncbi:MAG: ABC transporter permease [Methanobacteriota archaeon]|nr:MAG: ABC transporter permease [Euryarchaeota archaeon]
MGTAIAGLGLYKKTPRTSFGVFASVLKARLIIISRYKGSLIMELFMPIVFAALPIMLGVSLASGGTPVAENWKISSGTADFRAFMLIGACTFSVVSLMTWLVGFWVRREMVTGTLESVWVTPAKKYLVIGGVTGYALIRAFTAFIISFLIGSLIFGVNPFQGNILIAVLFIMIGLLPLWGISFMFGALILKVKEANSLINMLQWVLAFFMGVYFPVTVLPGFLRYVALSFPPTWMTNGVRASLLEVGYFFEHWYIDLAIIFVFAAVVPLLGYMVFMRTEKRLKKNQGMGLY